MTNLIEKIKTNKKYQIIIISVLFSLLLLMIGLSFINENSSIEEDDTNVQSYVQNLEKKLEDKLSKVEGVNNVSVIINVKNDMKTILASEVIKTEENGKTVIEEKPIIINGKTVVINQEFPEITGVLIVLDGVKNLSVINRVQQATITLLNIKLSQIEILT